MSLTEHTRPRLVKEVTYVFPAGGATLETMAKNVMVQFGVGNSRQCLPPPQGISRRSQWQLEDGSYMRLGVDAYQRNMLLYLSTPKWIASLEEQATRLAQTTPAPVFRASAPAPNNPPRTAGQQYSGMRQAGRDGPFTHRRDRHNGRSRVRLRALQATRKFSGSKRGGGGRDF